MKLEKLASGSYRIRKTINGKTYRITVDHKPGAHEIIELLNDAVSNDCTAFPKSTWGDAYNRYMAMKANLLSPSTKRGYKSMFNNIPDSFKTAYIRDIDGIMVQTLINDYSAKHSPKSVKNLNGLVMAVIKLFRPSAHFSITLPQEIKNEPYIPTDDDMHKILELAKGTRYYLPFLLGTMGLRRSEICALNKSDLKGNILSINKAIVQNEEQKFILKATTKTTESTRDIYLPEAICELIRNSDTERIFDGYPNTLNVTLKKFQKRAGVEKFKFHALRHYYASMAHSLGIPDSYVMKAGGWKTDNVMKAVYRHAQKDKEQEMQEFAGAYIEELMQ